MDAQTTESATVDVYKWMDWLHQHRKNVLIGLGVAVVIGVVAGIVVWKKGQDEASANEQLFTYAPVLAAKNPPQASSFLKIAADYPDTSAGEQAQLLAASGLFNDGKYADAQKEFTKFVADHPQSALVPQASVGVAASMEAQGQTAEAISKYQELVTHYPSAPNITSPAKLTLGRLYEEQNKLDLALKNYEDLAKSMVQGDPFSAEARERQAMLLARHPEMMKAAPAPMPGPLPTPSPTIKMAPPAIKPAPLTEPKAK